jgi:hypothetical protein
MQFGGFEHAARSCAAPGSKKLTVMHDWPTVEHAVPCPPKPKVAQSGSVVLLHGLVPG